MPFYSADFFKDEQDYSRRSAEVIVPLLMQWVQPQRVIDLGCALGQWLAVCAEQGAQNVLGVDGEYVDKNWLQIPADRFRGHDLSRPFLTDERFDLAICMEVAEHLPASEAKSLIQSLTDLSPVILFSAAVPGQGGVNHVNEQWQDYWVARFAEAGYAVIDCIRPRIWNDQAVRWWYAQNTLLYVRETSLEQYPLLQAQRESKLPISLVHPGMYAGLHYYTRPANQTLRQSFSFFREACRASIGRRLQKLRGKHSRVPKGKSQKNAV